ncbi:32 kDa beta-galactoside-binding lectin-like isoform X2 [Uloborus diversus]|nr:32 kDa beta-galactoside-binding lectin-like isoform X2 [Uloborus diversus]
MVVRNSRLNGVWGLEEQLVGSFPFPAHPRPFLLVLTAFMDSFEGEVNGSSPFSFKVRDGLPVSSVTHLAISSGVLIRAVHKPVETMPRNLRLSLGNGAKVGDMFYIRGEPTPEAKSFVINWQTGPGKFDDILFQLNPRLEEGRVVRNSRLDDTWSKEESSSDCPFKPDEPFLLTVGVTPLAFEVLLDGKEWLEYAHKQDISNAMTLFVEGDLQPLDISVDSALSNLPSTMNGIKTKPIRLLSLCPELPSTSRITGGFEKGCFLLLSGKVNAQPKKLEVSIQCGDSSDESDVALKYQILWEQDGTSKISLNSREEDSWGQELKVKEVEGPCPKRPFDFLIARSEDGFHCFIDGQENAHLPYRLEDQLPNHVTLCGDIETHRLLLL